MELPEPVYQVPAEFEMRPGPAGGQIVALAAAECESLTVGNLTESDVSIGYLAVLIQAPLRGEPEAASLFELETFTSSPIAAQVLAAASMPVKFANVTMSEAGITRHLEVTGDDVAYVADMVFPPVEGGVVTTVDSHHTLASWYVKDRSMTHYQGSSLSTVSATKGQLLDAMPAVGALPGTGSQPVDCEIKLSFEKPR